MILIVAVDVPMSIARHRKEVRGMSGCRPWGMRSDGSQVRIVSRQMLPHMVTRLRLTDVIWDDFEPFSKEKELVACRMMD